MHELTMIRNQQKPKTKFREESVEYQVGNEMIIQPTRRRYRPLSGKLAVGNIIAGIVIGAAIVWFLIVPSVDEAKVAKQNQQVVEYSNRINALEAQVSAQTKTLDEYRAQNSDKEAQAKSAAGTAESYENLMTVSGQYDSGTYSNATLADTLLKVNREALGQMDSRYMTRLHRRSFRKLVRQSLRMEWLRLMLPIMRQPLMRLEK